MTPQSSVPAVDSGRLTQLLDLVQRFEEHEAYCYAEEAQDVARDLLDYLIGKSDTCAFVEVATDALADVEGVGDETATASL